MSTPIKYEYILFLGMDRFAFNKINQNPGIDIKYIADSLQARDIIYKQAPIAILLSSRQTEWQDFLVKLKNDLVFKNIPAILVLQNDSLDNFSDLKNLPFIDWVYQSCSMSELSLRIHKCRNLMSQYLDASPLTRLPGNTSIIQKISECIHSSQEFAIVYLDIDNFKSFNDHYGFSLGDDLIRMTARLLVNETNRLSQNLKFVGHIGGDDFVFIIDSQIYDLCCANIIKSFDIISLTLISDQDQKKGFIEIENRKGELDKFPFPSISMAVIDSQKTKLSHIGEVAVISSELKKKAKKKLGSNYVVLD